ncbi:UDP-glucuronate:xylan alpha-glucuronosyltransferase 2 [Platanthera guangdongensis]|uniref:Hexosyltransferase n=1 Tax=Platanthera guangdongensis TaxID=2320717 RepID=A0ABR2MX67_9ASPA
MVTEVIPNFFNKLHGNSSIALINIGEGELLDWGALGDATSIKFERVSENLKWKDIFPEWIDEEEENEGPYCPEIPMPDFSVYGEFDVVAARVPCRRPEQGWSRDVFRLQVHLIVANLAVRRGKRDGRGAVKVVFYGGCRPMMEVFRCDDMVEREGEWWLYELESGRLEEKVAMPVGSCKLALPLWREGGINEEFDASKLEKSGVASGRREAYATLIHSSDTYVCGAITLAQSIRKTGSKRDLLLLHDKSIPEVKLRALAAAGWQLREIKRIRNPRAQRNTYNEYNYSKFRLWLLTDYQKVVFVDADIVVLRNLDLLFSFPQISAAGNDGVIFNSGIMVLEPSACTFEALMKNRKEITSYNGGDQGFLNEIFVWWHRLPRRVNFLKNFWSNKTAEMTMKNRLFASDPPKLYSIHYLGLKPWLCHRDYDCNWNREDHKVYASDPAHRRWWRAHDEMDDSLKRFCGLSEKRKWGLEMERKRAEELGLSDGDLRINIADRSSRRNL